MTESLLIGLSALQAQRLAMDVTSHNLANATSENYSRQRTDLAASLPEDRTPGQIGRGVDVAAIRRIVDSLTDERLRASASETARLSSLSANLQTVEAAFNEPGENGFAAVTNQLFGVLSDLSNNPESGALRSAAVQELQTWSGTLNDLAARLEQLRADARNSIRDQLGEINNLASQIAKLNQQIRRQTLLGNNPNDLLDARDGLVGTLSGYLQITVRSVGNDGSIMIDASGVNLVGMDGSNTLNAAVGLDGGVQILTPNGGIVRPVGGSVGALDELDREVIPGIIESMDELAATMALRLNALHATGTSQAMDATSFTSSFTIPANGLQTDLDDPSLTQTDPTGLGIPASFRPSFTDANGNATIRDLTINLRDTATGEARKYTVRYDPTSGSGSRTLQDLVQAINTGSGGGFTIYPPDGIGIPGLSAKAAPVTGGYQLQLNAASGYAIDFSQALDLQPARSQWAGPQVEVTATAPIPAAIGNQLQFEVEPIAPGSTTLQMRITSRNAVDGSAVTHGVVPISGLAGTVTVAGIGGIGSLDVTMAAGDFRAGDRFVIGLDAAGNVAQSGAVAATHTQVTERPLTDADFTISGRYSGGLGLLDDPAGTNPYTDWSMQVVSGGTIGAKVSSNAADPQPPVVQFSYWTGTATSPVRKTLDVTLDDRFPAGTPVAIADGVYAVFKDGDLTTTAPGLAARFTVDGQPDEAGLLPALGINGLFTGSTAATLKVAQRLVADPTQLNVGTTRAEGDNSNVLTLIGARKEKLFSNGSFGFDDHYSAVLADIGVRINQAERLNKNQASISAALKNQRQQISGVNIDEEVGYLILQQQAYTAAARVVTFSRENIQTLLQMVA